MAKDDYYVIGGDITYIPEIKGEPQSRWSIVGYIAFGMGITAASIHWIALLNIHPFIFMVILALCAMTVVFGLPSSIGLLTRSGKLGKDYFGLYGFLLGLGALILATTMYITAQLLIWRF